MKTYDLDRNIPSVYGEEDYTFREEIENGKLKVSKECNLMSGFKTRYYVKHGIFKIVVDGRQAKKYVKEKNV